jgi:hypothetical protein
MLEIGAGEAMEIPAGIVDFHNIELVDYMNDSLSSDFFQEWRSENDIELKYDECVGYKVPLFLGGQDDISNLERINLDVYIGICGQLRMSIKNK